jgi:hypothetical protein
MVCSAEDLLLYGPFYDEAGLWKRSGNIRLMHPDGHIQRRLNKDFSWPPYPVVDCDDPATHPSPRYDRSTKHVPAVFDAALVNADGSTGGWKPITEYATHALFMADACAALAGFIDMSYQATLNGTGCTDDSNWCTNTSIYQAGYYKFDLLPGQIVDANVQEVSWGVDPNIGNLNPILGVLDDVGTGFPIWKGGCDLTCTVRNEVHAYVDFRKFPCPIPVVE